MTASSSTTGAELTALIRRRIEEGDWLSSIAEDLALPTRIVRSLWDDPTAAMCWRCLGKGHDSDGHNCGPCKGNGVR